MGIDDEHQMMFVVAVLHEDVDAGLGEPPGEQPKLAGHILGELQHHDIMHVRGPDSSIRQRFTSARGVADEKVRDGDALMREDAPAFETDTGSSKRLTEVRKRARPVVKNNLDILHAQIPFHTSITVASMLTLAFRVLAM